MATRSFGWALSGAMVSMFDPDGCLLRASGSSRYMYHWQAGSFLPPYRRPLAAAVRGVTKCSAAQPQAANRQQKSVRHVGRAAPQQQFGNG